MGKKMLESEDGNFTMYGDGAIEMKNAEIKEGK